MKKFLIILGVTSCLSTLGFGITEANAEEFMRFEYTCSDGTSFTALATGKDRAEVLECAATFIELNCGE